MSGSAAAVSAPHSRRREPAMMNLTGRTAVEMGDTRLSWVQVSQKRPTLASQLGKISSDLGLSRIEWRGRLPADHMAWRAFLARHVQPADSEDPATGADRIRGGWSADRGRPLAADAGRFGDRGAARLDRQCDLAGHSDRRGHCRAALSVESPIFDGGGAP